MKPSILIFKVLFCCSLLTGCGGGTSDTNTVDNTPTNEEGDLTSNGQNNQGCGTFDEPVKKTGTLKNIGGVAFSSEIVDSSGIKKSITGITGDDGSYEFYSTCETSSVTTFCLGIKKNCSTNAIATGVLVSEGGGIIGRITSTETPIAIKDIVANTYQGATATEIEEVTTNVYQLLLSLDEDADSTNGVSISENGRNEAELVAAGINFADAAFDTNQSVLQLVAAVDPDGTLATDAEAQAFESTTVNTNGEKDSSNHLIGSWDFGIEEFDDYDKTILTLTDTGEFFFFNINSSDSDNCRERGYEYGIYERVDNKINLTRIIDTNGCVGLFDATESQTSATFTVTEEEVNALTATIYDPIDDPEGLDSAVVNWTRISTSSESIVGPWLDSAVSGEGNRSNLVLFLSNGHLYSMDADLSNTELNDFFYGDYTYLDSTLTRTWVFQSFPDTTFKETTGVEIVDGQLRLGENDILNRVEPENQTADMPLAFTLEELNDGFTVYMPVYWPEDCGYQWVVEAFSFNESGYSLDGCGLGNGNEVNEAFEVLPSGIVHLINHDEYVKRLSFDAALQAYYICWGKSELAASECAEDNLGLGFLSQADAEAYKNSRNAGFGLLSPGVYSSQSAGDSLPTILTLNEDGSGSWSYGENESGPIIWRVTTEGNLLLSFTDTGETETLILTSGTVDNGLVRNIFSNEGETTGDWVRIE